MQFNLGDKSKPNHSHLSDKLVVTWWKALSFKAESIDSEVACLSRQRSVFHSTLIYRSMSRHKLIVCGASLIHRITSILIDSNMMNSDLDLPNTMIHTYWITTHWRVCTCRGTLLLSRGVSRPISYKDCRIRKSWSPSTSDNFIAKRCESRATATFTPNWNTY